MKDPIVKVKLISGEPKISDIIITESIMAVHIFLPWVKSEQLNIEATNGRIVIELNEDGKFVKKFDVALLSKVFDFKNAYCTLKDGVLTITAQRINDADSDEPVKLKIIS
jgi:HSP20 family molecular chaperone IbpA